jgi:hypothetical protein
MATGSQRNENEPSYGEGVVSALNKESALPDFLR